MYKLKFLLLVIGISLFSCKETPKTNETNTTEETTLVVENQNSLPDSQYRMAAEWEPALGTMITWPLSVPYKLVVELAKDDKLYTLIPNQEAKDEAIAWYTKWGINLDNVQFIFAEQGVDAWWVRDWGPHAVFSENENMKLADGKYIYSTPVTGLGCKDSLQFLFKTPDNKIIKTTTEDDATIKLSKGLGIGLLKLPFATTGGNILTDGHGTAFSTCVLLNENRFDGISEKEFFDLNKEKLGINQYHIISNFEKMGIQHIDCYMKLLDEERILVIEPPVEHELYNIYTDIVDKELATLKTIYGRPYEILKIKTDSYQRDFLAAYTNSLILNKKIYVPLFGIPQDEIALKRWEEVMPGYEVHGFEFKLDEEPIISNEMKRHYRTIGWNFGDALHCRTRAVWNPDMLYISVKRLDEKVKLSDSYTIETTIIDYSKKGVTQANLYWRVKGDAEWSKIQLGGKEGGNGYSVGLKGLKSGQTIEYFIAAESKSGQIENMPRTAPEGVYSFTIE